MERPETPETPRLEPCSEVNPHLWFYFCALRGREDRPSDIWTEADVVQHLDAAEQAKKDNQVWRMFDNILHSSEKSLR
jgi:hypothetical protein